MVYTKASRDECLLEIGLFGSCCRVWRWQLLSLKHVILVVRGRGKTPAPDPAAVLHQKVVELLVAG